MPLFLTGLRPLILIYSLCRTLTWMLSFVYYSMLSGRWSGSRGMYIFLFVVMFLSLILAISLIIPFYGKFHIFLAIYTSGFRLNLMALSWHVLSMIRYFGYASPKVTSLVISQSFDCSLMTADAVIVSIFFILANFSLTFLSSPKV